MKTLFALFVLGAASLVACGGDAPKPADPTTPTAAVPSASAAPSATPPADPTKK